MFDSSKTLLNQGVVVVLGVLVSESLFLKMSSLWRVCSNVEDGLVVRGVANSEAQ